MPKTLSTKDGLDMTPCTRQHMVKQIRIQKRNFEFKKLMGMKSNGNILLERAIVGLNETQSLSQGWPNSFKWKQGSTTRRAMVHLSEDLERRSHPRCDKVWQNFKSVAIYGLIRNWCVNRFFIYQCNCVASVVTILLLLLLHPRCFPVTAGGAVNRYCHSTLKAIAFRSFESFCNSTSSTVDCCLFALCIALVILLMLLLSGLLQYWTVWLLSVLLLLLLFSSSLLWSSVAGCIWIVDIVVGSIVMLKKYGLVELSPCLPLQIDKNQPPRHTLYILHCVLRLLDFSLV